MVKIKLHDAVGLLARVEGTAVVKEKDGFSKLGITKPTYEEAEAIDIKEMETVYKEHEVMSDLTPIAVMVNDTAYHSGKSRAIKLLQKVVGSKEDGILGPITLEKVGKCTQSMLVGRYVVARIYFLLGLNQEKFTKGWINRVQIVATFLSKYLK